MFEFKLPDIGEGLTEADIVRWLIPVGGEVAVDQILVEVETAKAVVEMPSPVAGVVLHHGAAEGETLEVGAILAVIGAPGETWGGDEPVQEPSDAPLVGTLSSDAEELAPRASSTQTTASRVQALPLVRKLAKAHDVDLATVVGTGPMGRITREDVLAAANGGHRRPHEEAPDTERVKMSMLRRTIAEHMEASWREIPHVTTFDQANAGRLLAARKALARRHERAVPLEALIIKAVIPALRAFREFNATLDGQELILHGSHDIGVAVDTDDGLLVPVVRAAASRGLMDIARAVEDVGERGKARRLEPHEMQGATFTVSNIGAVGGTYGTPIIPLGTTAILSVGRAADAAVVEGGAVTVAPVMPLSLSFDHRVIDGGMGRRFMAMVIENLEEPALFLAD